MSDEQTKAVPSPVIRSLAVLGLLVAFLVVASFVRPADTTANLVPAQPPRIDEPDDLDATPMGWFESIEYSVEIFATPEGPRYDVYGIEGNIVARKATPEELRSIDPMLDPESMLGTGMGLVTDDDF